MPTTHMKSAAVNKPAPKKPAPHGGMFNMSRWKLAPDTGVSIFDALGIHRGTVSYPHLTAQLPAQVGAAQAASSPGGGGGGGGRGGKSSRSRSGRGGTGPVRGGTLSKAALEALWIKAGGNPRQARMAAAIALAESGGRSNALNHESNGTLSRGFWQINSVHGSQSTFDPLGNARAAVAISGNGSNWSPWSTFTSGAYRNFF